MAVGIITVLVVCGGIVWWGRGQNKAEWEIGGRHAGLPVQSAGLPVQMAGLPVRVVRVIDGDTIEV